ncbi:hypothetical protein AXF42_Ash012434 [Apostasia shenzhenica]|uniref:RRM domain-containing protein n=1 Tax=Apostasia shenzhenica TaxID=1088818 RepID=A0A2I0AQR3_9ASPA|nr:hypothetical protein AXF42_Ash012434 [Apostasia shenzhenica]
MEIGEEGVEIRMEVKRIYVGGVSAGVTAADMEKTFSSHGRVISVEFVRSNGRSFAYMDFEPGSDKSLSKLFSTYNGCTWKGGKLKLEMAKEHYLSRLKREWEEDAKLAEIDKLASATPVAEKDSDMLRSHGSNQENMRVQIFFPKLRKVNERSFFQKHRLLHNLHVMQVKSLPFKGTGKHKYSFQRIEVPPLPIHFCDCEEHSKEAETVNQKYLSSLNTLVLERERNIMNTVMNKLIGTDNHNSETPSDEKACIVIDSDRSSPSKEDFHCMNAAASDSDADNLVINIGVVEEDDLFMKLKGGVTPSMSQESGFGKQSFSKDRLTSNVGDSRKRMKSGVTTNPSPANPNKMKSSLPSVKPHKTNHPVAAGVLSSKFEPPPATGYSALPFPSHASPANPTTTERRAEPSDKNAPSTKGQTWMQKHSWKELVGAGSSTFSISTLLSNCPSASSPASKDKSSRKISVKDQIAPHNTKTTEKESQNHSSIDGNKHGASETTASRKRGNR